MHGVFSEADRQTTDTKNFTYSYIPQMIIWSEHIWLWTLETPRIFLTELLSLLALVDTGKKSILQ